MPESEFAEEQSNILALYKTENEKQQILQKRHSKEIDDHRVVVENAKKNKQKTKLKLTGLITKGQGWNIKEKNPWRQWQHGSL